MADGSVCDTSICVPMPRDRDWVLVDQLDQTTGAPNKLVSADWSGMDDRDAVGRFGHIRGLKICGFVVLTSNGANAAVSAYTLRGLFSQIILSDALGHEYWQNADGRNIVDDFFRRHMRLPYPLDGAVAAGLPAGDHTFCIDLEFSLSSRAQGGNPLERILSIAALQKGGAEALQFRLANTGATIPGNPAGLLVKEFRRDDGQLGLDIKADVVYTDKLIADAPWGVRDYQLTEVNTQLKYSGKHEYVIARHLIEDNNQSGTTGQQEAGLIDNLSVRVGKGIAVDSLKLSDLRRRDLELQRSFPDSAVSMGLPLLFEPADVGVTDPSRVFLPTRPREYAPAGKVTFKMDRPGTFTRFLHSWVECDTQDRVEKLKQAARCSASGCMQIVNGQLVQGVVDPTLPKIVSPNS